MRAIHRKMGRPTLEAATALKERLLERTLHMLCRHGINGLSMDALAEEAGITKRTIYRHFDSKMALIEEVVVREIARLDPGTPDKAIAGRTVPTDSVSALEIWARNLFFDFFMDESSRRFSVFLSFEQLTDPVIAVRLQNWTARATELPVRLVRQAQTRGEIAPGKPLTYVLLLTDLLTGPMHRMNLNYSGNVVTGGQTHEAFFAERWAAFMKLARRDRWSEVLKESV